jgi:transcriptional regulator with XRE-family HTH domain
LVLKGLDLKNLREKKGLTQEQLGIKLGKSMRTVITWEKSNALSKSQINQINAVFDNKSEEISQQKKSTIEPKPDIITNTNGNKFVQKEDGTYNVTVKLVPFDAYSSYVETLEDVSIVHEWEEVTFNVDQYGRGNYEAFRTKNDSMNGGRIDDTPSKSLVLARELNRQLWLDGFNHSQYGWIVVCKKSLMHKDITHLDKENGTITCHSRNGSPEYSDFELKLNDVYRIFKVIKRTF